MNVKLMKNVLKGKENGNSRLEKTDFMITCFVMVSIVANGHEGKIW